MNIYDIRRKLSSGKSLLDINLKVTSYCRVSTEHIEQKNSLINQITFFKNYITNNPNWTYVEGYIDEGISGINWNKRNNFIKMIEDAKNKKFDLIITKEISRFSRNTLDSIYYTRKLLENGVAVYFMNDNINTIFADSELRLTIMSSLAQDEIRKLSERVKFGMNQAIMKGKILGNNQLYGYIQTEDKMKLKICKTEAGIVKRLFEEYSLTNKSLSQIAKEFNKENIKTRSNNNWSVTTLSRMIKNIKYKGYYCGKKTEIEDYLTKRIKYNDKKDWIIYKCEERIPPIIPEEIWDLANKKLEKFEKNKKSSYTNSPYNSKIFCKIHNKKFYERKQLKNKNDKTWVCSEYLKLGKKYCDSANIRESELNEILKNIIISENYNEIYKIILGEYKTYLKNINKNKYLNINVNYIKEKLNSKNTFEYLISQIIEKIVVNKKNEIIILEIYFKEKIPVCTNKIYKFKRGYDIKSTKKHEINYLINIKNN